MSYHAIQICQPSAVVVQQVLELGEAWLEDAVRTATSAGWCGGPAHSEFTSQVHVRVGLPCGTQQLFQLPMEWELVGTVGSPLRGELNVVHIGPAEARIEVSMAAPPALIPDEEPERTQLERSIERATGLFLQRLFWTLQALTSYDLFGQRASGITANDRSSDSGGRSNGYQRCRSHFVQLQRGQG